MENITYCKIDSNLRKVTIPGSEKILGVYHDKDVTRKYFKMPRYYQNQDMSEFSIKINYVNEDKESDCYIVDDITVTDDDYITFTWLIGATTCKVPGMVGFVICFTKVDDAAVITQEYNTTLAVGKVLDGCEPVKVMEEESEKDIIAQFMKHLIKVDNTLSVSGQAADAKIVGERLKTIDDMENTLKKSVSDGKEKVATAITEKGVATDATATFDTMHDNILKIKTGGTGGTGSVISHVNERIKTATTNHAGKNIHVNEKIKTDTTSQIVHTTPYIIGNGVGYFNTGYKFGSNTKIEYDVKLIKSVNAWKDVCTFGIRGTYWLGIEHQLEYFDFYNGSGTSPNIRKNIEVGHLYRVTFDEKNKEMKLDDDVIAAINDREYDIDIPIFATYSTSGTAYTGISGDEIYLYRFKIYENDVIVRDYVPARDDNGIVCLHDTVFDTYLYDATNTNTFEYGEEIII